MVQVPGPAAAHGTRSPSQAGGTALPARQPHNALTPASNAFLSCNHVCFSPCPTKDTLYICIYLQESPGEFLLAQGCKGAVKERGRWHRGGDAAGVLAALAVWLSLPVSEQDAALQRHSR